MPTKSQVLMLTKMKITWFLPSRSFNLREERKTNRECPLNILNAYRKVLIQPLHLATFHGERKAIEPNYERLVRAGPAEKAWFSRRILPEKKKDVVCLNLRDWEEGQQGVCRKACDRFVFYHL